MCRGGAAVGRTQAAATAIERIESRAAQPCANRHSVTGLRRVERSSLLVHRHADFFRLLGRDLDDQVLARTVGRRQLEHVTTRRYRPVEDVARAERRAVVDDLIALRHAHHGDRTERGGLLRRGRGRRPQRRRRVAAPASASARRPALRRSRGARRPARRWAARRRSLRPSAVPAASWRRAGRSAQDRPRRSSPAAR